MYSISIQRKTAFRFSTPNRGREIRTQRRILALTILLVLPISPLLAVPKAQDPRKQIYQQAVKMATADIAQVAKQKEWPEYQVKINVFIPTEVSTLKACTTPLQGALPTGDRIVLARLHYDIHCEDNAGWTIGVTVKPDIYLPIVIAKTTLQRGEKIMANDIELKKRNISNSHSGYLTNPDDAVGFTVKKRIRDLQPIVPTHLEQPILVNRGQQVIMIADQEGISARTMGEAMKNGRKGDLIKVRNLSSGNIVSATVDNPGVVKIPYAPSQ